MNRKKRNSEMHKCTLKAIIKDKKPKRSNPVPNRILLISLLKAIHGSQKEKIVLLVP